MDDAMDDPVITRQACSRLALDKHADPLDQLTSCRRNDTPITPLPGDND